MKKLTWKDAVATALVGLAIAAGLAAVGSWGWPLLGSPRAAILVVAIVGMSACAVAGAGQGAVAGEPPSFRGPFGVLTGMLHIGLGGLVVWGLFLPSPQVVMALVGVIVILWLLGTIHHLVEPMPEAWRPSGATA